MGTHSNEQLNKIKTAKNIGILWRKKWVNLNVEYQVALKRELSDSRDVEWREMERSSRVANASEAMKTCAGKQPWPYQLEFPL